MNKELNNAIENNEKVYADNKKATDTDIKTIDDVIAAMNEINIKYDIPITNIRTIDDVKKCMEQTEKKWDNGKK
jgi:allophanate hydrolase subunit 1